MSPPTIIVQKNWITRFGLIWVIKHSLLPFPFNFAFPDQLFIGVMASDCKIPCLQTRTNVLEVAMTRKMNDNLSSFYFTIDQKVKTEIISVDKFNFNEFLNFLGANMGLWPGMGVFQILEGIFCVVAWQSFFTKIRNFNLLK